MTGAEWLVALLFLALFGFLLTGFPVAFVLAGTALVFAAIGLATGILEPGFILLLPDRIYGIIQNELLLAIPLFIAMGVVLEKSRIAEDLLSSMGRLFGHMRGGLGISVTLVGALLAASTGIVGATVVTMGLMSLPVMLKRGYDPALASGSIAAAGTLGQIIPPSIVLILLGDVLSSSYQEAQRDMGITAPEALSVGELFAGALIPGLGLVALYIGYQIVVAVILPNTSPAVLDKSQTQKFTRSDFQRLSGALLPPLILIVAVLGSILAGIATPTEAAAVGAVGAILLGAIRLAERTAWVSLTALIALGILFANAFILGPATGGFAFLLAIGCAALTAIGLAVSLWHLFRAEILAPAMQSTVRITVMIFTILIGAALFSLVFRGLGGDHIIETVLTGLPGGTVAALALVMLVMFLLGFFLDFIEITFVVVPIVAPVLFLMGIDPVWLGIMMALNLQTSFLTPPFGFALFYLRGVAPNTIKTEQIYKGALPFVVIQLIGLALLAAFPGLATWLPEWVYQ